MPSSLLPLLRRNVANALSASSRIGCSVGGVKTVLTGGLAGREDRCCRMEEGVTGDESEWRMNANMPRLEAFGVCL